MLFVETHVVMRLCDLHEKMSDYRKMWVSGYFTVASDVTSNKGHTTLIPVWTNTVVHLYQSVPI